ncbi:MAG: hypothetical protein U0234_05830 [Sandaracinus sp.]
MTSAPAPSSPFDGVVEFFTLSRASAQLGRLGEGGRKQVASTLALGRQRGEAAETLWSNGHTAEGLRLAFAALDATLEAASTFADALKLDQPAAPAKAAEPPKEEPKKEEAEAEKPADATAAEGETVSEAKADGEPAASEPAPEPKKDVAAATDAASIAAALRESIESLPPAPIERWRAALGARGVRTAKIDQIGATVAAKRDAKLPDLDADVSPALADLFQRVMDARHAVDAAVGTGAWTAGDMRWARVRRWLGASVLLAGAIGGSYFALHEPEGVFASASDVWQQNASFSADMAIDGRNDTWWILPDRATGWVEERMSPARHVSQVILLNSSNPPSHDRGTSDYRLEIYSGGTMARAIDGHFDWADSPQPVTHDIDLDNVERVRFVVRGYHRTGAGLAEMTVR